MLNILMPYDIYERHQVVSMLLRGLPVENVLDVGGNAGILKRFLKTDIVTLNVDGSADLRYDGRSIPFPDNRFGAVVTLDTLEHIPPEERGEFLRECLRVTQRYLIVAAPYGSKEHREYERRLDALFMATHGRVHTYLNEHVRYGIPDESEMQSLARTLGLSKFQLFFAGDFVWQCRNLEQMLTSQKKRARLSEKHADLTSKALFHRVNLTMQPHTRANRLYLFADKSKQVGQSI